MSQVRDFVEEIRSSKEFGRIVVRLINGSKVLSDIRRVKVHCIERGKNTEVTQAVLDPFRDLKDVRRAIVLGSVTPKYATKIEQAMTACRTTKSQTRAVANAGELNLDLAVLWRWKHCWNA
jgi:hypothetical protein